jgi:hypothetical protein
MSVNARWLGVPAQVQADYIGGFDHRMRVSKTLVYPFSGTAGLPFEVPNSAFTTSMALLWNALARAVSTSPSEASSDGRSIAPSTL